MGSGEEIVFLDLEFGSILICPKKLTEVETYETLLDLSLISAKSIRSNGITANHVASSPTFSQIADKVYNILHGRVWAGHNIVGFDCVRLREAYAQINRPPPVPKRTIDTWPLLAQRAGNVKMATLATYFGLGKQSHRSLGDVRMNIDVVKHCATVLFLESTQQDTENNRVSLTGGTINSCKRKATLEGTRPNISPFSSTEIHKRPPNAQSGLFHTGPSVYKTESD